MPLNEAADNGKKIWDSFVLADEAVHVAHGLGDRTRRGRMWQSTVQILDFHYGSRSIKAALIELNHGKLLERITETEYAIFERLQSLEGTLNCQSRFTELLAIEDA